MKKQTRICPYCQGSGNDPKDTTKPCPVCDGRKTSNETLKR